MLFLLLRTCESISTCTHSQWVVLPQPRYEYSLKKVCESHEFPAMPQLLAPHNNATASLMRQALTEHISIMKTALEKSKL